MPTPPQDDVTIVVSEREPGLVYVKMIDPKPAPDWIEFLLRRTIEQWFNARSQFVIDRAEPVTDHGTIQGIHVWYHFNDCPPKPVNPAPLSVPSSMTIEVHGLVAQQLPKEHFEAVFDEAMEILRSHHDRKDTLVVINRRRIAVVLDKQANRGAILPLHLVERALDASVRRGLQTWFESPPTRVFVTHLPGSWFVCREIADPAFVRTNMTYDTGSMRPSMISDTGFIRTKMTYDPGPRP